MTDKYQAALIELRNAIVNTPELRPLVDALSSAVEQRVQLAAADGAARASSHFPHLLMKDAISKLKSDSDGQRLLELAHRADPRKTESILAYLGHCTLSGELRDNARMSGAAASAEQVQFWESAASS